MAGAIDHTVADKGGCVSLAGVAGISNRWVPPSNFDLGTASPARRVPSSYEHGCACVGTPILSPQCDTLWFPRCCLAVVLSRAEREAYMRVHNQAADVWAAVRGMSSNTINQKLLQVMSLLQPLRRQVLYWVST